MADGPSITASEDSDGLSAECSELLGDDPGDTVELAILNAGDEPIYLEWPLRGSLSILAPGVDWTWASGTLCSTLLSPDDDKVCGTPFVNEQVLRIDPGAELTHTWDGQLFESEPVPVDCVSEDTPNDACETPANCSIPRTAPTGSYTASLTVYPASTDEDSQDCSDPICTLEAGVAGEPMEVEVSFDMPTTRVEIVW